MYKEEETTDCMELPSDCMPLFSSPNLMRELINCYQPTCAQCRSGFVILDHQVQSGSLLPGNNFNPKDGNSCKRSRLFTHQSNDK